VVPFCQRAPLRSIMRTCEGAFAVAEQFRSPADAREWRRSPRLQRRFTAPAAAVDGAGDEFLARTGLFLPGARAHRSERPLRRNAARSEKICFFRIIPVFHIWRAGMLRQRRLE
jgi:hypothetical protein